MISEERRKFDEWYDRVITITAAKLRYLPENHQADIRKVLADKPVPLTMDKVERQFLLDYLPEGSY